MENEHLRILKSGVKKWNDWRRTSGTTPCLENTDLSSINLKGANLLNADLEGASLKDANLKGQDLNHTNLAHAVLKGANLINADLSNANLFRAKLGSANLGKANLTNANLNGASLIDTKLTGADLSGADLRRVSFTGANLSGAILRGADLRQARLIRADLSNANLDGADLLHANLGGTIFANVDLSAAERISECRHLGPSTIDHRTLELSGSLSDAFLSGCGLSRTLIDYIPSIFVPGGIDFHSCFISHNSEDKEFARRLHDSLHGHGIRCWLDEKQIRTGDDIYEEVDRGIRHWDKIILCCSEKALTESWWVEEELKKALKKEQAIRKDERRPVRAVLPLALDRHIFDGDYLPGLKDTILSRKVGDFSEWKDHDAFEVALDELVQALRADEGRRERPPTSKL